MMKRNRLFTRLALASVLLAILVGARPQPVLSMGNAQPYAASSVAADPAAGSVVQRAWQMAQEVGTYDYAIDIVQTSWPLPILENVGTTSSEERVYIEGQIDLPADTMEMKLWSDGGSAQTGQDSLELRVVGDQAFGRVGGDHWEEVDDFTGIFAPGNDPLGYLVSARNVVKGQTETRLGITFTRYSFEVDGPAFASYMRTQMEDELRRKGKLPPGITLDFARVYLDMTGKGEIWLDSNGLPLRQVVHVTFPPDDQEQIEATIKTDFFNWGVGGSAQMGATSKVLEEWKQANLHAILLLGFLGLLVVLTVYRRSKKVYAFTVVFIAISMVVTPLLQSHHVHAFSEEMGEQRAEQEEQQRSYDERVRAMQESLTTTEFDPHSDPFVTAPAPPLPTDETRSSAYLPDFLGLTPDLLAAGDTTDDGTDSDDDGLTDYQEIEEYGTEPSDPDTDGDGLSDGVEAVELGTNPNDPDTDGDLIGDQVEVEGFSWYGQRWYLNPLDPDTNRDGLPDTVECAELADIQATSAYTACVDSDDDGAPDAFDFDDDGDGIPDTVDLSRTTVMGGARDEGGDVTGLDDGTFHFQLDQMVVDTPTFVDFQFRPVNPEHLWYTLNVLDWPSGDTEGQIQRRFDTTFKDVYDREGQDSGARDANGDLRLIPMLEIEIPYDAADHYGNLPTVQNPEPLDATTPITAWLDAEQTDNYRISVKYKDDSGTLLAYVPANLVRDRTGDDPVAFSARMFYRPDSVDFGSAQQVRLVWLVEMLTDYCAPPEGYTPDDPDADPRDEWCADEANWEENPSRVVHVYYDDWYMTGIAVREDHGVDVAVALENPDYSDRDPHIDKYLWHLASGLDQTFITGRTVGRGKNEHRDLTISEIERRFDSNSTATKTERWGIPAGALEVETFDFPDQSYLATLPLTHTKQILDTHYISHTGSITPTLLYAREENYRSVNLDADEVVGGTGGARTVKGVLRSNQVTLALDPTYVQEEVLAGLSWAPYRYSGAGYWKPCPIAEYWEQMEAHLDALFEGDPNYDPESDPDGYLKAGRVLLSQNFYLAIFHGTSGIVELGDTPIEHPIPDTDDTDLVLDIVEKSTVVPLTIVKQMIGGILAGLHKRVTATYWGPRPDKMTAAIGGLKKGLKAAWIDDLFYVEYYSKWGPAGMGLAAGLAVFGVGMCVLGAVLAKDALETVSYTLDAINFVLQVKCVVDAAHDIYKASGDGKLQYGVMNAIRSETVNLRSAANVAAIIGLIISAAISIGLFIAEMVCGGVQFYSLAFNLALAAVVAQIIVGVIMFAIGLIPIVGPIIVAIVGLIDAIIGLVCKITGLDEYNADDPDDLGGKIVRDYVCGGISGALAHLVQFLIYSQNPVVDLENEDRLEIANFDVKMQDHYPTVGFVAGNKIELSAEVTTTLYTHWPVSPLAYTYGWQYAEKYVKESSFEYGFSVDEEDLHLTRGLTTDSPSTWQEGDKPFKTEDLSSGYIFVFDDTGINQEISAYLNEGHAINAQECFLVPNLIPPYTPPAIPVCYLRDKSDTFHFDLGLTFDILPGTLDGFYDLAIKGGGYTLAWGEDDDITFPVQADADGDGLRSAAFGGDDLNDSRADIDADGLSDFTEVKFGSDPELADTDGDGLTDYEEVRYGTHPRQADTDHDGLKDGEEIAGWEYIYAFGADNQPLITHVTADPLNYDSDGDGLQDKLEQVYGLNPRVAGPADIMSIESVIDDADGLVAPGDTIVYTATIANELKDRYALGLLEVEFPVALQNESLEPQPFELAPRRGSIASQVTMAGDVTVDPGVTQSQAVSLTNRAGATLANLREGVVDGRYLWLHLDENEGATTFVDSSLQGNHGACAGTRCPTAGVGGYGGRAVALDGNDRIAVYPFEVPDEFEENYTLSLWFKTTSRNGGLFSIANLHPGASTTYDRQVYLKAGAVCARLDGEEICTSDGVDYANGGWHNVIHVYGGARGVQRLYVNGIEKAAGTRTRADVGRTMRVFVGYARAATTDYFTGAIDEVEVYLRALTDQAIEERFALPVFHARFDESAGVRTFVDASPYHHTVTCESGDCPAAGRGGAVGKAVAFDQTEYMHVARSDGLDLSQGDGNFTLAAWVYPKNTDDQWRGVFGRESISGEAYNYPSLFVKGGVWGATDEYAYAKVSFGDGHNLCEVATSSAALTLNTWQHVVATFNGTLLDIYVDGQQVASSNACAGMTPYPAKTFDIGRTSSRTRLWLEKVVVEDEGDGDGPAEYFVMVDLAIPWSQDNIYGGYTYYMRQEEAVYGDGDHILMLYEDEDGECCRDGNDLNVNTTFNNTDLGDFSQAYDKDGKGTFYWGVDNDFYRGRLDDLRVYRHALDQDGVRELYQSTVRALELRFDESTGASRFFDHSGNDLSGACSGDTCPVSGLGGRMNQAVRFDGVDDYVDVPLDVPETNYAVSLWFRTTCRDCGIFSADAGTLGSGWHDRDIYLSRSGSTGNLCARVWDAETICTSGTNYADGQWHHVTHAVGNSVGGQKLYVDGQEAASGTKAASDFTAQTGINIGFSNQAGSNYFDGAIDQVTIVRKPLTLAEADQLAHEMPVLNVHFDDFLGATSFDNQAGGAEAGACDGDCPEAGADGWMRGAAHFDGIDDIVSIPYYPGLSRGQFSIGLWVKPMGRRSNRQTLLTKEGWAGAMRNYGLFIEPDSMQVNYNDERLDGGHTLTSSEDALVENQWNHVMVTFDGTTITLYINGSDDVHKDVLYPAPQGDHPVYIGGGSTDDVSPQTLFAGEIDEVVIYRRALPKPEVEALYEYQVSWYDTTASHEITVDADAPVVDIDFSLSHVDMSSGRRIAVQARDATTNVELVQYRVDGGGWQNATRDESVWIVGFSPASEGAHTIEARAYDSVGNVSAVDSVTFVADGTPPAVAVDSAFAQQTLPSVQSNQKSSVPVFETTFPRDGDGIYGNVWWTEPSRAEGVRYLGTHVINRVDYGLIITENSLQAGREAVYSLSINDTVVGTFSVFPEEKSKDLSFSFSPMGGWPYLIELRAIDAPAWANGIKIPLDECKMSFFGPDAEPTETVMLAGSASDLGSGVAGVWVELLDEAGGSIGERRATLSGGRWQIDYRVPGLSNGRYTVRLKAKDEVGNAVTRQDEVVGVDSTPAIADLTYTAPTSTTIYGVGASAPTIGGVAADVPYPGGRRLHLHFEEPAGATEFRDGSGRLLAGTCSGGACPTTEEGVLGQAARFDGDDYVVVDSTGFEAANYTVMAWFKTGGSTRQTLFAATDPADSTRGLWIKVDADGSVLHRYRPAGSGSVQIATVEAYNDDAWHHVAVIKDGTMLATYVDGQRAVTGTINTDWAVPLDVALGRQGKRLDSQYLTGLLDEVVVYERPLGAGQIRPIANPAASGVETLHIGFRHAKGRDLMSGQAAYLSFDEAAGATTFVDLSPMQYHGTCAGSTCPTAGQPGKIGQALSFDGSDDVVSLGNAEVGRGYTFAAWIRPDATGGTRNIIYHGLGSSYEGRQIFLRIKDGHYEFGEVSNTTGTWLAQYEIPPGDVGQWVHIAGTRDAGWGAWKLYRNGNWVALSSYTHEPDEVFNTALTVGARGDGNAEFFDGRIDEVTIYDRALNEGELKALIDPLRWREVPLDQPGAQLSAWSYRVPEGIEGPHIIDLRTSDQFGRTAIIPNVWSGEVDTWAPRLSLSTYSRSHIWGYSERTKYYYECDAQDYNLTDPDFQCPGVPLELDRCVERSLISAPWYTSLFTQTRAYRFQTRCWGEGVWEEEGPQTAVACDLFNQCTFLTGGPAAPDLSGLYAGDGAMLAPAAPPLGAIIFTPTAESIVTPTESVAIEGLAYAQDSLQSLTILVNGVPISTTAWACSTLTETLWSTTWMPAAEGVYTITARVTDCLGATAEDTTFAPTIYADVTLPDLILTTAGVSQQNFTAAGYVVMNGLVSDTLGVARLQVKVNDRGWEDASVPTATVAFEASAWIGTAVPPAGETFTLAARATDLAGHVTGVSRTVWADAVPPEPVTVTLAYTDSLGVRTAIAPGETIRDVLSPTLFINWTGSASSDVAQYLAGWTVTPTLSAGQIATLGVYGPTAREHAQQAGEAQALYAHVVIEDTSGNQTVHSLGPIYIDYTLTPAYIAMDGYTGWMEDGCSLIGVDRRVAQNEAGGGARNAAQRLYATWDAETLHLAWTGAHWGTPATASLGDGDLFVYLDTQPGGTNQAYNPYSAYTGTLVYLPGATPPVNPAGIPRAGAAASLMEADYLVWVTDSETAWLWRWDGSEWVTQTLLSDAQYRFDPALNDGQTDLILPFGLIGLTAGDSLDLVAFASEDSALRLWATAPAANPLSSSRVVGTAGYAGDEHTFALSRQYHWDSVEADLCPGDAYPDVDPRVDVTVEPAGTVYSFLGDDLFWLWNPLLDNPPVGASGGFGFMDVDHPLLPHGQVVSYTIHYRNQGDDTATNVTVDLTAHYALSLLDGASDHQIVHLGDVAPGAEISRTFRGEISLDGYSTCRNSAPPEACTAYLWAAVDALVYDADHASSGPPVEWIWVDHQVDGTPPEFFGIRSPEYLIAADENTLYGYAYDAGHASHGSGVPEITLRIETPAGAQRMLMCPDGTPYDGLWSCDWDTVATNGGVIPSDGDQFSVSLQAEDGFGLTSDWTTEPAFVFTVDSVPPTVTLSLAESQITPDTTLVSAGHYALVGQVADNHGLGHVEVCEGDDCALADVLLEPGPAQAIYKDVPETPEAIGGVCLTRYFSVTEGFAIGEVSLGLNLTHPLREEVQVVLESPTGTQVQVVYGDADLGAVQNYDVFLNDAAVSNLHASRNDGPAAPYYDRAARPSHPLRAFIGEPSAGTWTLTVCDTDPAQNDGVYNRGSLVLRPRDTASRTGRWSYWASISAEAQDYVSHTLSIYGVDLVGNRTGEPLALNFAVDNVGPAITVTNQPAGATFTFGAPMPLDGTVSDGGGIRAAWLTVVAPNGGTMAYPIDLAGSVGGLYTWAYTDTDEFVLEGAYTLWVEAMDKAGNRSVVGPFELTMTSPYQVYLPVVQNDYKAEPLAPDLVVVDIAATDDGRMRVVIKNEGSAPVTEAFWVDVYVNPNPVPTGVNQIWNDLASQGLVWGVTEDALPLAPGDILALTVGDAYYWPEYSQVSWPIPASKPIYAQVDSANTGTTYGAVLETHELSGGAYNNIAGPVYLIQEPEGAGGPPAADSPITADRQPTLYGLPLRPNLLPHGE
jgi:subtilisin-like proprotein convertase family protein